MPSAVYGRLNFGIPDTLVPDPEYPGYELEVIKKFNERLNNYEIEIDGETIDSIDLEKKFGVKVEILGYYDYADYMLAIADPKGEHEVEWTEAQLIEEQHILFRDDWAERLKVAAEFIGYPMDKFKPGWYLNCATY